MTLAVYTKGDRWAAFRESVAECRACRYWRSRAGGFDALCRGHAKVSAEITREGRGLRAPIAPYTHCPEHGSELVKGECPVCEHGDEDDGCREGFG